MSRIQTTSFVGVAASALLCFSSSDLLAQRACVDPPPGMIAWWAGDLCWPTDQLGEHHGTMSGCPFCPEDAKVGGGALGLAPGSPGCLPGTYVTVPHAPDLDPGTGGFTIEAWIRTEADTGPIAEKLAYYGYYFALFFDGRPGFGVCDDGSEACWIAQAYTPVNDGAWHHLAGVVDDESGIALYIDGQPAASTGIPGLGDVSSAVDLLIGASPSGATPTQFFDGAIDELSIFNRALGAGEIEAIYLADGAGKCRACDVYFVPGDFAAIQLAIDHASDCDEIVVGAGTYNEAIDLLGKAITLRSSAGAEGTTIDASGLGDSAVKCVSGEGHDTVIEGFTITGGTGNTAALGHPAGGGMFNYNAGSPTVIECVFDDNTAQEGGGMYNGPGSNPTVIGCTFSGNETLGSPPGGYRGGGMFNAGGSAPRVENCLFEHNSAGTGGAVWNTQNSNPTIVGCAFSENESTSAAGAMYIGMGSDAKLTGCTFRGNTAWAGGGGAILNWYAGTTLVDCTFTGNTSWNHGGGVDTHGGTLEAVNCKFLGNVGPPGGGMHNYGAAPVLFNCIFSGNVGGGMYSTAGGSATLMNCSFFGQPSGAILGGIVTMSNSILWDNGPDPIVGAEPGSTVNYSVVQGGWSGEGSNNMDTDPLCADPDGHDDTYGTEDDNLRLLPESHCIDAGDNVAFLSLGVALGGLMPPGDLDGNARFLDAPAVANTGNGHVAVVDMGAYEYRVYGAADFDHDGDVDAADLAQLLGCWGPQP